MRFFLTFKKNKAVNLVTLPRNTEKSKIMKKALALFLLVLFIGSLYSCKPREKCPAYGYQPKVKMDKSING